jgi:hypothetical protein
MIEQLGAQSAECARQQPGDMHLGNTDLFRNLRLGHFAEEPQHQNRALAFGQRIHQRAQGVAVLDALQLLVELTEPLGQRDAGLRIDRIQLGRLPVGLKNAYRPHATKGGGSVGVERVDPNQLASIGTARIA